MDLLAHLKHFFKTIQLEGRPLILGYSGGTDSAVLFELLLAAKIPFVAAHIDHAWRESSAAEAKMLEERAKSLNVPFYSIRLNLQNEKGNLEEICRIKRYAYFKELAQQLNAAAVCLAHHRDDRNETTLTRLLQGYSLCHLNGMNGTGFVEGLAVLRPFLDIPKSELLKYPLNYAAIEDVTNHDVKYLRARLRALKEGLGKEIEAPLARISKEADELKQFLSERLAPVLCSIEQIPCGCWLDLSNENLSRFEMRFVIREFLRLGRVVFSHHLIDSALDALQAGKANHTVEGNHAKLVIDRKHLFLIDRIPEFFAVEHEGPAKLGWKQFLRGELIVAIPEGAKLIPSEGGRHASHVWNNCHVPAFLREWAPMLETGGRQKIELLSGRDVVEGTKYLHIKSRLVRSVT